VTTQTTREVRLVTRPFGEAKVSDCAIVEVPMPELKPGQILVRNTFISVDPYMRSRMDDVESYVPPFRLDEAMDGGAIGEVTASASDRFAIGDMVSHALGWREHALVDERAARKVQGSDVPISAYLGVLGVPGLTAYVGLLDVAGLGEKDTVFVSGAAGAVGSLAGQLAKLRGHRVIGSAGSAAKVVHLVSELGFDAAFDYREGDVAQALAAHAPEGVDVYFDNVGGDQLEAAIAVANNHARFALCGAIAQYNQVEPPCAPRNLGRAVGKRLTMRGFIVSDHFGRMRDFVTEVAPLVAAGRIRYRETIVDGGIEAAPGAFIDMLAGANTGKMLVRL
jgi:NADPH-dependent curcumin reductase CurA